MTASNKPTLCTLIFFIFLSSHARATVPCDPLLALKLPPILIDNVEDPIAAALLREKTEQLLQMFIGFFPLPAKVQMGNDYKGPLYRDGFVSLRYPFENEFAVKSAEESLAINLHEVVHYIFETYVKQHYSHEPEVIWSFFTETDMLGSQASLNFIKATKAQTKFAHMSDEEIQELFSVNGRVSSIYNELLADFAVAVFFKDPDAIYKSIYTKEAIERGGEYDREQQESHSARRFDQDFDIKLSRGPVEDSAYTPLLPTKKMIWQWVFKSYSGEHPDIPMGNILRRFTDVLIRSLKQVTKDFTHDYHDISGVEINENLVKNIELEFKLIKKP